MNIHETSPRFVYFLWNFERKYECSDNILKILCAPWRLYYWDWATIIQARRVCAAEVVRDTGRQPGVVSKPPQYKPWNDTNRSEMKTAILLMVFLVGVFATPLTRREYEKLDDLLRELIERDSRESHDSSCKDSDFGVMGDTCQDYLRDLYDNKLGEMCSSGYYKVHCCRTCTAWGVRVSLL